jgi:hypothetical protein
MTPAVSVGVPAGSKVWGNSMAMAGWYADPLGIHEKRFFNGHVWTDRVTDREVERRDPLGNAAPPPPYTPTVSGIAPQYAAGPQYGVAPQYGTHPQYVVAQQYVVVNPQHIGNGFAVAALVLGIIGVLFAGGWLSYVFGLICGLLALVFGLLGRRNVTTRGASLGGLATAGIVLGCVALALGFYTMWRWHRVASTLRSFATQVAAVDADPTSNQVRVTSCYRDSATQAPAAAGTLVNTSGEKQAFRVTIAFRIAAAPTTVYGSGTTDEVSPGDSASWTARDLAGSFQPTSCKAVRANAATP